MVFLLSAQTVQAADANIDINAAPLVVGNRSIHVFRAPLGAFSAAERAESAKQRIERAFDQAGDGWTSIRPTPLGISVELDGQPLFLVLPGDARTLANETPEDLANKASQMLRKAWDEAQERHDPQANLTALAKVAGATVLLVAGMFLIGKAVTKLRIVVFRRLARRLRQVAEEQPLSRFISNLPLLVVRSLSVLGWLLGLFLIFVYLSYSLGQFALTRPASEALFNSLAGMSSQALIAVANALPGMFIAVLIFMFAWVVTRITTEFFASVESRPSEGTLINAHTAPSTRRIVNTMIWLFTIAMAYPYLPGSHTEAFKGLSVIVGVMVSIGSSGVIGQIASGVMIVYTYALKKGEYVRIQNYEGTVTDIGLFVTRLRTGLGEEIALPNAFVLSNVTRNFSRIDGGNGFVLDTDLTIGYDTPWRQVHAMLIKAAGTIPEIMPAPAPYVVQTALSDFYVAYKLVVHVGTEVPAIRARVVSDLHAAIQDVFNQYGVQIMSPHYLQDPAQAKIVPESAWHAAPAKPSSS